MIGKNINIKYRPNIWISHRINKQNNRLSNGTVRVQLDIRKKTFQYIL